MLPLKQSTSEQSPHLLYRTYIRWFMTILLGRTPVSTLPIITHSPPTNKFLATAATTMNFFLAILGLSAAVKPDLPEQICKSLMTMSGSSTRQPFPLVLKMTELINTIDEASEFSRQGHIANYEDITSSFNVTDFAARDAGRALFAYTGRLSPSLDMYVTQRNIYSKLEY